MDHQKVKFTCKEMMLIGFCGKKAHLEHHIWEVCGSAKLEQQELSWKDC